MSTEQKKTQSDPNVIELEHLQIDHHVTIVRGSRNTFNLGQDEVTRLWLKGDFVYISKSGKTAVIPIRQVLLALTPTSL
jgi:hypothetical protein